jgi:hypothetical protein
VDWILAIEMPYCETASVRPFRDVSLNDLSLNPPVSDTMHALNEAFDGGGVELCVGVLGPLDGGGVPASLLGLLPQAVTPRVIAATTTSALTDLFTSILLVRWAGVTLAALPRLLGGFWECTALMPEILSRSSAETTASPAQALRTLSTSREKTRTPIEIAASSMSKVP